jgi:hypothetical protein
VLPSAPADCFTAVEAQLAALIRLDCVGEADPGAPAAPAGGAPPPRGRGAPPAPRPGAAAAGRAPQGVFKLPKGAPGPANAGVQKPRLTLKGLPRTASLP